MQRFDIFAEQSEKQAESTPAVNGHSSNGQPDIPTIEPISPALSTSPQKRTPEPESVSDSGDKSPPKKKRRSNLVDADAIFAAKLQAEENLRARPTRGANSRKIAPVKKKKPATKSKTSKKVKAEDDSDLDAQDSESKKEVTRTGGFHVSWRRSSKLLLQLILTFVSKKPLALSAPLSVLLGGEVTVSIFLFQIVPSATYVNSIVPISLQLSRPQAVKKVWQYIRENNLQDPADRRQIRCDDLMRAVFKQDRIHMFTMTKILNHNLYNLDEWGQNIEKKLFEN